MRRIPRNRHLVRLVGRATYAIFRSCCSGAQHHNGTCRPINTSALACGRGQLTAITGAVLTG